MTVGMMIMKVNNLLIDVEMLCIVQDAAHVRADYVNVASHEELAREALRDALSNLRHAQRHLEVLNR